MQTFSRHTLFILLTFWPLIFKGQNCDLTIIGQVRDQKTSAVLNDASIEIEELKLRKFSDQHGHFLFTQICPGEYHINIQHLGCTPKSLFIKVSKDTALDITLLHYSEIIDEVELHGEEEHSQIQVSSTLTEEELTQLSSKGLSNALQGLTGVSTIGNGDAIAKPVVHGLWGNRVSILNNEIPQSGQQWGIDHAPEIDPFTANHVSVIKGTSALVYGGVTLGGVVLVEPSPLSAEPHLHGKVNYALQSNGWGNTLNVNLEKGEHWGNWRVNGTLKIVGDRKSPNYYLTNTGNRESNLALAYQKQTSSKYSHEVYYSLFNTEIGILRGSHISNSSDLEDAIGRDVPFFTKDHFSYTIEAPRQRVQHHLLKYKGALAVNGNNSIHFKYGGQWNNRKEFDVRRAGRTENPSLSLLQINQFIEAKHKYLSEQNTVESGIQYTYVDNTNDNESTGRLPLIPDYRSNQISAFSVFKRKLNDVWQVDLGARFDLRDLEALTITDTIPRTIARKNHTFFNYNFATSLQYTFSNQKLIIDLGFAQRQPEVNELYSSGLHQGLASIEYGNPDLVAENSLKVVAALEGTLKSKTQYQILGYYQYINDYIFLEPTGEFELTISGSFPVFVYNQTNAQIFGVDALLSHYFSKQWQVVAQASYLKGDDLKEDIPLIYMPPNNAKLTLNYFFEDGKRSTNTKLGIRARFVAEQKHIQEDQDFLPPPPSYFLLGFDGSTQFQLRKNSLIVGLSIDNLLNTTYRDYLNRLRYFADDLGINVQLRLSYQF